MTSSSSITQLVSELCESHLAGLSWKGVQGGAGRVSREVLRRKLKRRAYEALLPRLFHDPPVAKPNAPLASRGGAPPLIPARNKVLMLSFNLRVSGHGGKAERLEELLGELRGGSETDAVLDLLVHLAGSVPPQPPSHSRDFFCRSRKVGRRLELGGYEGSELRLLEAQAWSLVCGEECRAAESLHRTLAAMEASPGTGLIALGPLGMGETEGEERYERETRLSLFGALVHTRTADMDIRLDLPPVPSNAELTGLAIRVPPSLDQSEDEGFQSASNLSPDSQSEPSLTPDIDVWNAVLSYEPSQSRCWERVGCPPGKKEEPYLTEAGREAFDRLYQVREGEIRLLSTTLPQTPPLQPQSEAELVKKTLHMLIGVASATFSLDQSALGFHVMPGVYVSGTSPDSVASLLEELAEYGTHYWRLSRFSLQPVLDSSYKKGLVFQAFTGGVRRYLHYYRACVLSTPPTLSLLTIVFLFRKLGRQLRYLSELCWCGGGTGAQSLNRGTAASFPTGVKLLSYLYNEAQNNCSNENYPVLLSLLKSSCEPYTRFIYDWVYSGVFRDVYGEFMIQVNEDYLSFRDKHFWTQGYLLISKDVEDCVPVFLRHIANEIYVSGKTINLLRVCCPRHYICWSELPVPRIAVTFSLQELEEIQRDCGVYRGRMERIARYSAINREEKALRTELARQELIVQVRETTAKALETIRGRQVSQRLAQETKKRERFQELKQQLVVEQERRSAAQQQEADSDFGFAREIRDRERRLQALEEQLESQARRELIEHYSRLSEEAAARERRALWKVQRLRLGTERNSFLQLQQRHIQAMLEKFPLGEHREQLDIIPKGDSPRRLPAGGKGDSGEQGAQEILKHQSSDPSILREHPPALEAEPQESENRTPDSVQEAPGDPHPYPTGPLELGEQAPQARLESPCPLDIHDFLPKQTPDLPAGTCPLVSAVDAALLDIGSELPEGASGLQQEYDFSAPYSPLQGVRLRLRWNTHQHTSQANIQLGQYASDMEPSKPRASIHGHVSEANIKVGQNISEVQVAKPVVNVHGHSSESNIQLGQYASNMETSKPRASVHGHVSDATIQLGDESKPTVLNERQTLQAITEFSEGDPDPGISEPVLELHDQAPAVQLGEHMPVTELPGLMASVPGQASEENLKIMQKASERELSLPHVHIQGHASEAHIKLGGYMSDTELSKPRVNIHGHASEGSIKVGEYVSDADQVQPHLSIHRHASDSSIKVGGYVSDSEQASPHWSVHGHASDSSIKVGEYTADEEPSRPRWSSHGHASQSHFRLGKLLSNVEPFKPCSSDALSSIPEENTELGTRPGAENETSEWARRGEQGALTQSEEAAVLQRGLTAEQLEASVESLLCQGPPWGVGEGLGPEWPRERAYLHSLAAQYQVEQYQDSYNLMTAAPDSHLLHQVTAGPYAFPVDPSLRRATDTTAVQLSEMVSLPVLMKHSVTAPLLTHVSLVNKAIVDYYFMELNMERHCEALRHFLLMEDGEFAQSLSDLLFEKLGSGQTPGELLNPLVLNSILNKSLQYSLHGDSQLAANLTFALRFLPESFHPHAPDALACLELRYKVDWPLNIVITDSCMNKYNRIFSFLLQLKHMVWTLRDVWFHLKRAALVKGAGSSVQFRQLQLYRHEMQHFVKVIQGYIANQILHVTWSEFRTKLGSAANLDDIHHTHADYLNRAIFRGLLTEKAAPVMNIIHSIFSLILKFRAQLISQPWSSQQGAVEHPSFGVMQQSYRTFKYYSHFLFKVVTKLVNRGYQPHLEDFLLRINFNSYYQDS